MSPDELDKKNITATAKRLWDFIVKNDIEQTLALTAMWRMSLNALRAAKPEAANEIEAIMEKYDE